MQSDTPITDETRNIAIAGLSLLLAEPSMPFALTDKEKTYGPNDWAWLFLSMNEKYGEAFNNATQAIQQVDLSPYFEAPTEADVYKDTDGRCARDFGLAAWLSPSALTLPQLLDKSDSWFFPLHRPIAEDYKRQEVGQARYTRPSGPLFRPNHQSHTHYLIPNESTFGYRRSRITPPEKPNSSDSWNMVWVAIDCSVPPDAQVTSLKALATVTRKQLMEEGWNTDDSVSDVSVKHVTGSECFGHMRFTIAQGVSPSLLSLPLDLAHFWRAVSLDVLGPIGKQTDEILERLREVHQQIAAQRLIEEGPWAERFQNMLPSSKDSDGQSRHGGSYLKALLIIAQLSRWRYSPNQIADVVLGARKNHAYEWQRQFHENIERRYRPKAEAMINDGYRWLVHAQKPERQ